MQITLGMSLFPAAGRLYPNFLHAAAFFKGH
jgi:hypothetical protein